MARNRRRFGYIRKFPSNRYQASYLDPRTNTRISAPNTFRTKTAADHWLVDIEALLRRDELPNLQTGRMTFDEWARHWVDTRQVRPKTRRGYQSILDNHLLPHFGKEPVNTIDRHKVSSYLAKLSKQGQREGTVANIRRVFSMVMNEAMRSGAIVRNPADGVRVKRSRRAEMVFLSREQVCVLAHAIANPLIRRGKGYERQAFPAFDFMVRFVSETGLRAGEIAALRVGHIDVANRRVNVMLSATEVPVTQVPEGITYDETKTYETRSVPLPRTIANELARHLKTRPEDRDAFVFVSAAGGPIHHSKFYNRHFLRAVKQTVDENGKPLIPQNTRFHDLRHTYATLLIAAGANPLTVKQRMGHSSITVTMDRYGHLFPHLEEDLTDRMDRAYLEASQNPLSRMDRADDDQRLDKDNGR